MGLLEVSSEFSTGTCDASVPSCGQSSQYEDVTKANHQQFRVDGPVVDSSKANRSSTNYEAIWQEFGIKDPVTPSTGCWRLSDVGTNRPKVENRDIDFEAIRAEF